MALITPLTFLFFVVAFALFHPPPFHAASARSFNNCEELPAQECAFAVMQNGSRCVLEKTVRPGGASDYKCQTSAVVIEQQQGWWRRRRKRRRGDGGGGAGGWIESERCIRMCGLPRLTVGLSTDALHEHSFTTKLCLSRCRTKCPNIVDLYTKLAEGEGMKLDQLCDSVKRRERRRRASSAAAAKGALPPPPPPLDRGRRRINYGNRPPPQQQEHRLPPLRRRSSATAAAAAPSPTPPAIAYPYKGGLPPSPTNNKNKTIDNRPSPVPSSAPVANVVAALPPVPSPAPVPEYYYRNGYYYGGGGSGGAPISPPSPAPNASGIDTAGSPTQAPMAAAPIPPIIPMLPPPRPRVPLPFPHFGHFPPLLTAAP